MIPHTGNIENAQHIKKKLRRRWSNQKKAAGVWVNSSRSQPAVVFSCFQQLQTSGRWFMQKKGRWQSNAGVLYLREHKSSPHVQNKCWEESEGLSGRSGTSRGLWENPTTVCCLVSSCRLVNLLWEFVHFCLFQIRLHIYSHSLFVF